MSIFRQGTTVRNLIGGLAILTASTALTWSVSQAAGSFQAKLASQTVVTAGGIAASPLHAGELPAKAGESIDLGRFHGVVYYTREADGYRVVATIADGEAGLPVRLSATLADNQSATISVPGEFGEPGHSLKILRSGDTVTLTDIGRASGM
jgi:hypothetical protein